MSNQYPLTLEAVQRNLVVSHLEQLSQLDLPRGSNETIPKKTLDNYLAELENWSKVNQDVIDYAIQHQAFGGPAGATINWRCAFLAFMETATVYLRDEDKVEEAVALYKARQYKEAIKKLDDSVANIKKVGNLWGMDFQMFCDLPYEGSTEHSLWAGPFCGAFYSRNPAAPFVGIAFKGTNPSNYRELLTDANYGPYQGPSADVYGTHVSNGVFNGLFGDFPSGKPFDMITRGLQALLAIMPHDGKEQPVIHVTGHSLGGSYSNLCFTQYTQTGMLPQSALLGDMYTFGSPRSGQEDFAKALRDHLGENTGSAWRIVNEGDPIPTVPPVWPDWRVFIHVDTGYRISASTTPEKLSSEIGTTPPRKDPVSGFDNHKIEHYYAAMQKALSDSS